jgi:hypothetical protein
MMHGPEKSDPGIVAMKPANKTEQSVADANRLRPWWLSLEKCAEHLGPSFLEVGVALQSALQQSLDSLLRFGPVAGGWSGQRRSSNVSCDPENDARSEPAGQLSAFLFIGI